MQDNPDAHLSHCDEGFNLFSEDGWQEDEPGPDVDFCNAEKILSVTMTYSTFSSV